MKGKNYLNEHGVKGFIFVTDARILFNEYSNL